MGEGVEESGEEAEEKQRIYKVGIEDVEKMSERHSKHYDPAVRRWSTSSIRDGDD